MRVPTQPSRVVGIDLGTTNSTIAEILWRVGEKVPEVRCLEVEQPTRQGPYTDTLVPSVVALHEGQLYVGEGAKDLRARIGDFGLEQSKNIFWDCKNDIGIRRTYHKAPPAFQAAKAIGGHLVKFLVDAALADDATPITSAVVTVPASFQAAQRQDTTEAAGLGGLTLEEGALLDEPVAAFIDFLVSHGAHAFGDQSEAKVLAVFDFGGGTCDVALFELLPSQPGRMLQIAPLTVSRYHRLGGGDIDRTIVVDVLLPQLTEQNGLSAHDLDFTAKDKFVIPALLGVAESLKIGLCREVARLKRFGRYTDEARAVLVQKNPSFYTITLPERPALKLQSPRLSAVQFDAVLKSFLDRDLLYARETDYGLTCSIFAPLQDALDRAGLGADEVDLCLLVGGSTLIPQIPEAVAEFFPKARQLRFDDADLTQTAVARGAAWQALSLALYGRGIVQPVASDDISIQTRGGPVRLIESGTPLPYPVDWGWAEINRLVVPQSSLAESVAVRVELRDSHDAILSSRIWEIDPPVNQGDALLLRYRMDGNQVLHLNLSLVDDPGRECQFRVENPLTNVVNPNAKRDRIAELEERIRTKAIPGAKQRATVEEIALLYADLGQRERALGLLSGLLKRGPDLNILNRMGIICGELGDFERQERFYREAAKVSNSGIPLFNLALSQKRQGRLQEAMGTIDEAIARDRDPPYLILKASLADALKQPNPRDILLRQAFDAFDPLRTLDDWSLGWYRTGAQIGGDSDRQHDAEAEQKRRRGTVKLPPDPEGVLPGTRSELARR
jgi:molecular chaperone DnaK (HSP70)